MAALRGGAALVSGIPVLMYHALEDDEHPAGLHEPGAQLYTVHASAFRDQLRYLQQQGFRTVLLDQAAETGRGEKTVVLTFDDGHRSNATLALPLLQEFGFLAEFFVTSGWIGQANSMTAEQVGCLGAAGMGVGSHGVDHAFLDELSEDEALRQLAASRDALARLTGRPVRWFSAPGGRLRPRLELLAAQAGYRGVCTSAPGLFSPAATFATVPRVVVGATTSPRVFARLVHQPPLARAVAAARHAALGKLKQCLGNEKYAALHNAASRFLGRL